MSITGEGWEIIGTDDPRFGQALWDKFLSGEIPVRPDEAPAETPEHKAWKARLIARLNTIRPQ